MRERVTPIDIRQQMSPEQTAAFASALYEFVNTSIELLDIIVGDPDLELNGDEFEDDDPPEDEHDREHEEGDATCPTA